MPKYLGDASFVQLLTLVKEKIDTLLNKIEEKQQPYVVAATADFASMTITGVTKSFSEIANAHKRGDHVFLSVDISQMYNGQHILIPMGSIAPDSFVQFVQIVDMSGPVFVYATMHSNGLNGFSFVPLVSQTQLGGLTFTTLNSAPTVDDSNVISFVDEG